MARSQELLAGVLVCLILGAGVAQAGSGIGLRAGIGTDISGGIAYGFGGNYLIPLSTNSVEVGIAAGLVDDAGEHGQPTGVGGAKGKLDFGVGGVHLVAS